MAKSFHLRVLTADGTVFEGDVSYVNLPVPEGSVGVLAGHAPMLCAVERGTLRATADSGEKLRIRVGDGVAGVADGEMTVLLDAAELTE